MELKIAKLASRQHGLITRAQAIKLGATPRAMQRRLEDGRWHPMHKGVYALASHQRTFRQMALAACFAVGSGAVASHSTAVVLSDLMAMARGDIEVTGLRRVRIPGVTAHRVDAPLSRNDRAVVHGIPVTSLARTLFDIAAVATEDVLEEILDEILRRGVAVSELRRRCERSERRRRGVAMIRELLGERRNSDRTNESKLDTKLFILLRKGGIQGLVRQYEIRNGETFVARVDFAIPELRIAIEGDGYRYHSGRRKWLADTARATALGSLNWVVLRFTWDDVHTRPDYVLRCVGEASARAR